MFELKNISNCYMT